MSHTYLALIYVNFCSERTRDLLHTKSRLPFRSPSIQVGVKSSNCVEIIFTQRFLTIGAKMKIDPSEDAENTDLGMQAPVSLGNPWHLKKRLVT